MSIPSPHAYRNLIVWQRSMDLLKAVHELTDQLPDQGTYGLKSEMRHTAFAIPTHIAAGRMRGTKAGYVHSLRSAYADAAALETAMALILSFEHQTSIDCSKASALLEEVMKMLNALMRALTVRKKQEQKTGDDADVNSDTAQTVPSSALRQPTAVS